MKKVKSIYVNNVEERVNDDDMDKRKVVDSDK